MAQSKLRSVLVRNLYTLRGRIIAADVVWVLPAHPYAAARVMEVARNYGDRVVSFTPGPDHVHPQSYKALTRSIARVLGHE